jgi:lipoprotein-anchoring transpeptidase ErfK/SrfK
MAQQVRQSAPNQAPEPIYGPAEVWVPAAHASNHRTHWPSKLPLLLASFVLLLSLVILFGAIAVTLVFYASDMILPGVTVLDVPVGARTRSEAAAILAERVPQKEVLLMHSAGAWPVPVGDLGLTLDVDTTLSRAYEFGRTLPSLQRMVQGGLEVVPAWSLNTDQATAVLSRLEPAITVLPVDAQVQIEQGEVIEIPAQGGLGLDTGMTLRALLEDPTQVVKDGRLPLATRVIPAQIADVGELASEARRLLSKQVTLRAYDPVADEYGEWIVKPRAWQSWLSLLVSPRDADPFTWVVDEAAAQRAMTTQWPWLGEGRYLDAAEVVPQMIEVITSGRTGTDARVYHQPRRHTVRPGESFATIGYYYGIPYPWLQQANPDLPALSVGDVVTIPSADEMLPLPVVENKRIVVSMSEQKAWVYEDGQLKWEWPVSTGINTSPTSPGVFQIQSHEEEAYAANWDLYMPSFMGIYRPIPGIDFMNGFHGFPTRDGANLLWTADLGSPVTYGCILLSSDNAATLYNWAEDGVVVEVQR